MWRLSCRNIALPRTSRNVSFTLRRQIITKHRLSFSFYNLTALNAKVTFRTLTNRSLNLTCDTINSLIFLITLSTRPCVEKHSLVLCLNASSFANTTDVHLYPLMGIDGHQHTRQLALYNCVHLTPVSILPQCTL